MLPDTFFMNIRLQRGLTLRFQARGATNDRHRHGQPRVTTRAQDRHMLLTHLRNRFQAATQTAAHTPGTLRQHGTPMPRLHWRGVIHVRHLDFVFYTQGRQPPTSRFDLCHV